MANRAPELFRTNDRRFAGTMLTPAEAAGNHNYYFELRSETRNQLLSAVKCPYVQKLQTTYIPATDLTFTLKTLYEEHEGFRARIFQLQGVSGYTTRDMVAFKAFLNFWELVQQTKSAHLNPFLRGEDIRVILHFPFEGESYYCNLIDGFNYARDRSTASYSFAWSLRLHATGYAAKTWSIPTIIRDFLLKDCSTELDTCHTGLRHPCREAAIRIKERLDTEGTPVLEILDQLDGAALEIEQKGELSGPDNYGNYLDLLRDGSIGLDESLVFLYSLPPASVRRNFYWYLDALGWFSNLIMEAKIGVGMWGVGASIGIALGIPSAGWGLSLGASFHAQAGIFAPGFSAYFVASFMARGIRNPQIDFTNRRPPVVRPVVGAAVEKGEHSALEAFERTTGQEPQVVRFPPLTQGLLNPVQWEDGRWVQPGDVISVPSEDGLPNVKEPLGIDWKVKDGDFVWDDLSGDFVRVTGVDCYLQNLAHRFLTPRGANKAFPVFGLMDLSHEDSRKEAMLVAEAQRLVVADPRTAKIARMEVESDPPTTRLFVDVELINGARITRTITG